MSGLAPIVSSALLFLVTTHAGGERDVDTRWGRKTTTLGDFDEIKFVHVEDGAERVGGVGMEVGSVALFCGL